jgi:hypothetical protein
MGLDQYLYKKTYVKNWSHHRPEQRHTITITGPQADHIRPERIAYIIEEVAYWRKANQIHSWFVRHIQNGVDDCGEYDVSREQLAVLLDAIDTVLASAKLIPSEVRNGSRYTPEKGCWEDIYEQGAIIEDPTLAAEVLPCTPGFFFGATDYDDHYIAQLEYTRNVLLDLLTEDDNADFSYRSSW